MRGINKLTARFVDTVAKPGRYSDGQGLYLRVTDDGRRSWALRHAGRETGLGSARDVTLAQARRLAAERRGGEAPALSTGATFAEVLADYVEAHRSEWTNGRHAKAWAHEVERLAAPLLAKRPAEITPTDVAGCLRKAWPSKTAQDVRSRIELVWDAAKAARLCSGSNPAQWRGTQKSLLAKFPKKSSRPHHAAMPFADVPGLMGMLHLESGIPATCLRFCILTATRSGEARLAKWSEIDIEGGRWRKEIGSDAPAWRIPAERMKARTEHSIPLSESAIALLRTMRELCHGAFVFPGRFPGQPLGERALYDVLVKTVAIEGFTVHGFRSAFADWAAERTSYKQEVREAALAHATGDHVELAYKRTKFFGERIGLMAEWGAFCSAAPPRATTWCRSGALR
jgi:integrase